MNLPSFKYHPAPIDTGNIIESKIECCCCGKAKGYIYTGPVYAIEEYSDGICPWCIADGSAHEKLDASFTDHDGIGGWGEWDTVPKEVIDEVAYRTPGFSGWQQEQWWTHCKDAGQFLGRAGHKELKAYGPEAIKAIYDSTGLDHGPEWERFFSSLDKEGSPTAYVFRCSSCGKLGGYQDCD
jgi:uncharacterized protein CbrC (UPF0167 family)